MHWRSAFSVGVMTFGLLVCVSPVWAGPQGRDGSVKQRGDRVEMDCPAHPLRRTPAGPVAGGAAQGSYFLVASTVSDVLIQSSDPNIRTSDMADQAGAGHYQRGWVPQACFGSPVQVADIRVVDTLGEAAVGPLVLVSWDPGSSDAADQLRSVAQAVDDHPGTEFLTVLYGEEYGVASAVMVGLEMATEVWRIVSLDSVVSEPGIWVRQDSGDITLWGEVSGDLSDRGLHALARPVATQEDMVLTLDALGELERSGADIARSQSMLSSSCRAAALEITAPPKSEYVDWMASLVASGSVHDLAFWDLFVWGGKSEIHAGPALDCFFEAMEPFVAFRVRGSEVVVASPLLWPGIGLEEALQIVGKEANAQRARALWVTDGIVPPRWDGAIAMSPFASRVVDLGGKPRKKRRARQQLGFARSGPEAVLVVY